MGVTRERLFEEVWAEPMTTVAKRYKVSSNYLARVCERMGIPRPARGYWAKLLVGQRPSRPALRSPEPFENVEWTPGGPLTPRPLQLRVPSPAATAPARVRRTQHPLITEAALHFANTRPEGYSDVFYLRPLKRKVLDLLVSKENLDAGLKLANLLFQSLEARGHRVAIAPAHMKLCRADLEYRKEGPPKTAYDYSKVRWAPMFPTVVFVGSVPFGLTVFEISEEVEVEHRDGEWVRVRKSATLRSPNHWTTRKQMPTGRFGIHVFSSYRAASWERYWREDSGDGLSKHLDEIADTMNGEAPGIIQKVEQAQREAEEQRRKWEGEERERKRREVIAAEERTKREAERLRAQAFKDSRDELFAVIASWEQARTVAAFLEQLENAREQLPVGARGALQERIEQARRIFGAADALAAFRTWRTPQER